MSETDETKFSRFTVSGISFLSNVTGNIPKIVQLETREVKSLGENPLPPMRIEAELTEEETGEILRAFHKVALRIQQEIKDAL